MATAPQSPMSANPGADPSAAAPDAETDDGGYVIEIKVDGQGKISVCVENESGEAPESAEGPEGAEGSAADPSENEDAEMSQYQPAANIKEALTMALEIYKNDGKLGPDGQGDSDFQGGFANRGGSSAAY